MLLRPFDEVGNDQEVTGKAHIDDHVELEIQPLHIGLCHLCPCRLIHFRGEQQRLKPLLQPLMGLCP